VYQNAAVGLEVRAPEGMRFAVGDELFAMNQQACVGLVSADPEAYIVWILSPASGVSEAEYVASERLNLGAEATDGETIKMSMGELEFPMTVTRAPGNTPLMYCHGTHVQGGVGIQVLAWCLAGLEERALPQIERALKAARLLEPAQRASLATELRGKRDPQNVVGEDYCLRGGTYRHFGERFTWTKPPGFWRVDTGAQARARNEDATIFMQADEWGVSAMLFVKTDVASGARDYHDSVMKDIDAIEPPGEPQKLKLGETPVLMSMVRSQLDGFERTYFFATAVQEKRAYQMIVWCLSGNAATARPAIDAAIQGLRLTGKTVKSEEGKTGFVDNRLGFRVKKPPGKGWMFRDATPPEKGATNSALVYASDAAMVVASAMCDLGEKQDSAGVRNAVIDSIRKAYAEDPSAPSPATATVLAGLPAERVAVASKDGVILYIAQRDSTLYYLVVQTDGKKGSPTERELVKLFELMD
jgi:hypothetical protein